jgi:hypothetical protein
VTFPYTENFFGKVKIFQRQSNENFFETLTKKELQEPCQASPSCANSIYRKYEEAFRQWWEKWECEGAQ